jgi:hypothetical protein
MGAWWLTSETQGVTSEGEAKLLCLDQFEGSTHLRISEGVVCEIAI